MSDSEAAQTYSQLHAEVVAILTRYSMAMYATAYSIDQVNDFLLKEPNLKLIQETATLESLQKMILQTSPAILFMKDKKKEEKWAEEKRWKRLVGCGIDTRRCIHSNPEAPSLLNKHVLRQAQRE